MSYLRRHWCRKHWRPYKVSYRIKRCSRLKNQETIHELRSPGHFSNNGIEMPSRSWTLMIQTPLCVFLSHIQANNVEKDETGLFKLLKSALELTKGAKPVPLRMAYSIATSSRSPNMTQLESAMQCWKSTKQWSPKSVGCDSGKSIKYRIP